MLCLRQVLLPMLEGRMDSVAPPAPEPAAEEELPAEARGRGEAAQPALATGTPASVAAAREMYLARCCAMRTAPVTKLLKPDAAPDAIDLTHRGLGNRGAVALATFVAASAPLRALRLADNNLAREGAEAVFDAVSRSLPAAPPRPVLPRPALSCPAPRRTNAPLPASRALTRGARRQARSDRGAAPGRQRSRGGAPAPRGGHVRGRARP